MKIKNRSQSLKKRSLSSAITVLKPPTFPTSENQFQILL
jgi:hypothetical protein